MLGIKNAFVIDGLGNSFKNGNILVEGKKILAVGNKDIIPSDLDEVIDLNGKSVLPGIIDAHTHVTGGDVLPQYPDYPMSRRLYENIGLYAYRSYEAAKRCLVSGVTTILDVGGRDYIDIDLRDAVEEGLITGPTVIGSGIGITPTGGHVHYRCVEVDGENEVMKEVRRHVKRGVDCIKIMGLTGGLATKGQDPGAAQFRYEEVRAAVEEANRWGKITVCHGHGLEGIMNAINAGVTTLSHGMFLNDEAAKAMADKGIYFVPTLLGDYMKKKLEDEGRLPETTRQKYEELKKLGMVLPPPEKKMEIALKHKVKIIMGTDCGGNAICKLGENLWELVAMVEMGISPMDTIIAATSIAAEALRINKIRGSIESGKYADLVVVDGNPLKDIKVIATKVDFVVKEGKIVKKDMLI